MKYLMNESVMEAKKNNSGFTVIEIAIVLIILKKNMMHSWHF